MTYKSYIQTLVPRSSSANIIAGTGLSTAYFERCTIFSENITVPYKNLSPEKFS